MRSEPDIGRTPHILYFPRMLDIVLVQMESVLGEKARNFTKVKTLLDNAGIIANDGGKADGDVGTVAGGVGIIAGDVGQAAGCKMPRLIILPEMFNVGYIPQECHKYAEDFNRHTPADECTAISNCGSTARDAGIADGCGCVRLADGGFVGETVKFLQDLADERNAIIFGTGISKTSSQSQGKNFPTLYNHTGIFLPRKRVQINADDQVHLVENSAFGEVSGYNKIHPFFPETKRGFSAGEYVTLFKIGGWRIASVICYDLRFPELFREAIKMGANLITVQAAWPKIRKAHWETLLRARAIENQVYIAAVNGVSPSEQDPTKQLGGTSMLIDPQGNTIAIGNDSSEAIVRGQITLAPLEKYRQEFPVLQGIAPMNANPQGTIPQDAAALTSPRDAT